MRTLSTVISIFTVFLVANVYGNEMSAVLVDIDENCVYSQEFTEGETVGDKKIITYHPRYDYKVYFCGEINNEPTKMIQNRSFKKNISYQVPANLDLNDAIYLAPESIYLNKDILEEKCKNKLSQEKTKISGPTKCNF